MDKKIYRLDLTIAIEALDNEQAYQILTQEETLEKIKELILNSQDSIKEALDSKDQPAIIN